jgi:hypothetical protein
MKRNITNMYMMSVIEQLCPEFLCNFKRSVSINRFCHVIIRKTLEISKKLEKVTNRRNDGFVASGSKIQDSGEALVNLLGFHVIVELRTSPITCDGLNLSRVCNTKNHFKSTGKSSVDERV